MEQWAPSITSSPLHSSPPSHLHKLSQGPQASLAAALTHWKRMGHTVGGASVRSVYVGGRSNVLMSAMPPSMTPICSLILLLMKVSFTDAKFGKKMLCMYIPALRLSVAKSQMLHLPWGIPSGGEGSGSCLLTQQDYITLYSNTLHIPLWTAFKLTKRVCKFNRLHAHIIK